MKKIIFLFVITALLACNSEGKKAELKDVTTETVKVVENTVNISGMHCDNCVASVEKGINSLTGIESVAVSFYDSNAIVKFDASKTDLVAIKKAIEKRGYTIIE